MTLDGNAHQAVKSFWRAHLVIQPNADTITPVLVDFLSICLHAKCVRAGLLVLSNFRYSFSSDVHERDILAYYYYAACVFAALQRYEEAVDAMYMVRPGRACACSLRRPDLQRASAGE